MEERLCFAAFGFGGDTLSQLEETLSLSQLYHNWFKKKVMFLTGVTPIRTSTKVLLPNSKYIVTNYSYTCNYVHKASAGTDYFPTTV